MVDEVSIKWGDTPLPTDGRWNGIDIGSGKTFDFGDDAFLELMETINSATSRTADKPPISWPPMALHGAQITANWMGDDRFSDYASMNFWGGFGPERPYRHFYHQFKWALEAHLLDGKLPFIQQNKPKLAYCGVSGPYHVKNGPGEGYKPGQDTLLNEGTSPKLVTAVAAALVAHGMSGVKSYFYEFDESNEMGKAYQVGGSPFSPKTVSVLLCNAHDSQCCLFSCSCVPLMRTCHTPCAGIF